MPFDSNGTFNRAIPGGWQADAAAGTKIKADRHDAEDDGFASGLSTCITKDGRTQPTADLPMNGKKLLNLSDPSSPQDAATKNYVDNFKTFNTGATIAGAGPINGFVNFTSPSGVNGIGWTTADMSWVGKVEEASKTRKRLTVNDAKDGTGTDVCIVDETGNVNNAGALTNNLSNDGANWRTISLGIGTKLTYAGGVFTIASNDTATTVDYQTATPRTFFTASNGAGTTSVYLDKSASGKVNQIVSTMATKNRWVVVLGGTTAETATDRVGSNFAINSYDNAGTTAYTEMTINRQTHSVTFGGSVTSGGTVVSASNFDSTSVNCILSATNPGAVYLRPNGPSSSSGQAFLNSTGYFELASPGRMRAGAGYNCHTEATIGGYTASVFNINWQSPYVYVYIDNTLLGAIAWQSDYRFKKDIRPLPSTWDKVKCLNPIRYSIRDWGLFTNDNSERWGFIAHEMQQKLTKNAATGDKDADNVVQQIDPLTVVAALTKALQEAMQRIETLEAKLA